MQRHSVFPRLRFFQGAPALAAFVAAPVLEMHLIIGMNRPVVSYDHLS